MTAPLQRSKVVLSYIYRLGVGGFPEQCLGMGLGLPPEYTKFVWGWPYRFLKNVSEAGARFYLLIDTEEQALAFAGLPVDGVITDYIEVVGRYYKR